MSAKWNLVLVVMCSGFLTCNSPVLEPHPSPSIIPAEQSSGVGSVNIKNEAPETLIWSGHSGEFDLRWTTADLYLTSVTQKTERIFTPLVEQGFRDFATLLAENPKDEQNLKKCSYQRRFSILSVVGNLLTFRDEYSDYCGGAHPSTDQRLTTIDLRKKEALSYKHSGEMPLLFVDVNNRGKIVALTDYFPESQILSALLKDPGIKEAITNGPSPKNISQLLELLEEQNFELKVDDFYARLPPDFLTRFVFYHADDKTVTIRIGLSPSSQAGHALEKHLSLVLATPEELKEPLALALSRQQGFMMRDAAVVIGGKTTVLNARFDNMNRPK